MITQQQVQTALQVIFPPRCVGCGDLVGTDFHLCGTCWAATPFIGGVACDTCRMPLPGHFSDTHVQCDDCLNTPRPWAQGRAVLLYEGHARQMVLRLKHGDRHDIARPAGHWMAEAAKPLITKDTILCPVPLHWSRLLRRRFNQTVLLADVMARQLGFQMIPDLLIRTRATRAMEGMTKPERIANLRASMAPNPKFARQIKDANILLVDDVMTSGATFAAASEACLAAFASQVNVIALARVAKLP